MRMAIREPYGADDVFATSEEAKCEQATITDIPLSALEESRVRPEVQEMLRAAADLGTRPATAR
jgi:hypothetical protein